MSVLVVQEMIGFCRLLDELNLGFPRRTRQTVARQLILNHHLLIIPLRMYTTSTQQRCLQTIVNSLLID